MIDIFNKASNYKFDITENPQVFYENIAAENVNAMKAVSKMRREKNQKTIEEQKKELGIKFKREQNLYETYDFASFETKLRLDALFFESIFEPLQEVAGLEEAVGSFYRTVRQLYEMVNLRASSHKSLGSNILTESANSRAKTFKKIINEHLNNYFYRLSPEKRKEKYLSESTEFTKELIESGAPVDTAIDVAVKSVIFESLIKNIAIPKFANNRIKRLCEDKDYGLVFDQERLKSLFENYNLKAKQISKILAITN